MIRSLFTWRLLLALVAIAIVSGTVFYSQYLASKIAFEERQKMEQWLAASKSIMDNPGIDLALPNLIRNEQTSIPIIETNDKDSIVSFVNLDTTAAAHDPGYVQKKLREFKSSKPPLVMVLSQDPYIANRYYYGNTPLLNEVRYYPLIQLLIVALFIVVTMISISTRNRATQDQVWAGMAKETAHQLGTPISSLQGWLEMLRENPTNDTITVELEKDINRLKLVSDRFSKIGSTPRLEPHDLVDQVRTMVDYMRKRATGKVQFSVKTSETGPVIGMISPPLFDWVIENLLKNALDAMEGKGSIAVEVRDNPGDICIDVTDTGKGINAAYVRDVFKPGFTTKKRGWGLGLSLSKRIIEQFHHGQIFVKWSEPGKGTTFRVLLKKDVV